MRTVQTSMRTVRIQEGDVTLDAHTSKGDVSKKLPVFYNPAMALNRDVCMLLLRCLGKKQMSAADILAGTGVRSLRLAAELPKGTIKRLVVNDANPLFPKKFTTALKQNKLNAKTAGIEIRNQDANLLLEQSEGFDYIDIDPFGSPNPFIDAATRHLARDGILALTATDTAALAGTSPAACKRKYWADPLRNHLMHEISLRILARKAQLVAAQYEKALTPIFCHATLHYTRLYLRCEKSKEAVDDVLSHHKWLAFNRTTHAIALRDTNAAAKDELIAGPLWAGPLWDTALARKMATLAESEAGERKNNEDTPRLLKTIAGEAQVDVPGFYDLHEYASMKKRDSKGLDDVMAAIKKSGYRAARTHFTQCGIRTDAPIAVLKKLL